MKAKDLLLTQEVDIGNCRIQGDLAAGLKRKVFPL